jgi:uncharacterized membrane protein YjfL (UPF0719 family)
MVLLVAAILFLARVIYGLFGQFDVDHELTAADNPAIGASLFGYLTGVVIVLAALLSTESRGTESAQALGWDLAEVAIFGLFSVLLLRFSGLVNDRLILHRFENKKELITDRNLGAGAVLCGTYVATGLMLAGAVSGRVVPGALPADLSRGMIILRELGSAAAFFVLGQLVLVGYGQIYQRLFKTNPLDAIEADYEKGGVKHGGNAAAGIAMGGNMVAIGVVLWGGTRGDFVGWPENLTAFGIVVGVGLVLLPLWRVLVDRLLLGSANMADEIYRDRNPNAALLESVALVGLAVAIALMARPELVA